MRIFLEKIWDSYLKKRGKRPYTEDELNSMFLKELDTFLSYFHLRFSRMAYDQALDDKEFLLSNYNKIIQTIEKGHRSPSLRLLYGYVKRLNKNGFT